jgi:hypothetical protein
MPVISGFPRPPAKGSFEDRNPHLFWAMLSYMIFGAILLVVIFSLLCFSLGPSNALNPLSILLAAGYLLYMGNRPLAIARKKTRIGD